MFEIDCNFPGGNIIVHGVEGDKLDLSPDLRDTTTEWFYWAFRVRGAAGRHLHVHFTSCSPVGMRGPAISTDGRLSWHWTTEAWDNNNFEATVPDGCDEIYFAFAPVYTQENWDRFMKTLPDFAPKGSYEAGTLTTSRKGRAVEVFHVGQSPDKAEKVAVITARHHCCEMIASYAMEGIIKAVLSGDTEEGRWLRDHASITFIPFADKDGVEDGDQGKNRAPRDHNNDHDLFLYPETRAITSLIAGLQRKFGVDGVIDLHCPWIRDYPNDIVYTPGRCNRSAEACQIAFGKILEKCLPEGSLPYYQKNFYPFGKGWNNAVNYGRGRVFINWTNEVCMVPFATTFEIAYASASGVTVTPDGARLFGKGLAIALARYFQK